MLTLLNSSLLSVASKLEQLSKTEAFSPQYLEGLESDNAKLKLNSRLCYKFEIMTRRKAGLLLLYSIPTVLLIHFETV